MAMLSNALLLALMSEGRKYSEALKRNIGVVGMSFVGMTLEVGFDNKFLNVSEG